MTEYPGVPATVRRVTSVWARVAVVQGLTEYLLAAPAFVVILLTAPSAFPFAVIAVGGLVAEVAASIARMDRAQTEDMTTLFPAAGTPSGMATVLATIYIPLAARTSTLTLLAAAATLLVPVQSPAGGVLIALLAVVADGFLGRIPYTIGPSGAAYELAVAIEARLGVLSTDARAVLSELSTPR